MTQIVYPSGQSNESIYNGLGLRVSRTENLYGQPKRTYHNITDGTDPASPLLSDGYTVYTPGLSERPVGGSSLFHHQDSLGSTVATSGPTGSMSSDQHFDAFGVKSLYYVQSPTVFGYGGKHQYHTDGNSGLLLLGHRYYDPSIGRFISQDPAGDGANWYAYCGNNPLVNIDPTGTVQKPSTWDTAKNGAKKTLDKLKASLNKLDKKAVDTLKKGEKVAKNVAENKYVKSGVKVAQTAEKS